MALSETHQSKAVAPLETNRHTVPGHTTKGNPTPMNTTPGNCRECGAPTEIIARRIGFFGLHQTWCTHCRDCLPAAARAAGFDPDQILAEYDSRTEAVRRGQQAYAEKTGGKDSPNPADEATPPQGT